MATRVANSAPVPGLQACLTWLQNCFRFDEVEIYESLRSIFAPGKSTIVDLINILRDGIVLCQLSIILSGGSVRRKDLDGFKLITLNSVCIYRDNLQAFLGVCKGHFQLPSKLLFTPDDLIKRENVERVIGGLSALSQSPKVDQARFPGFQVSDSLRVALRHMNTRKVASELTESIERFRCTIVDVYSDRQLDGAVDEETYCSLVDAYDYEEEDGTAAGNWYQLVLSERNYVHLLDNLATYYRGLDAPAQMEAEPAFLHIPELHQLHARILRQLEATARIPAVEDRFSVICDCVAGEKAALCKVYREYLVHMPVAIERADELQKGKEVRSGPMPQHRLRDLLLAPLQRVQRYPDIFKGCREMRPAMDDLMEVCCYMQSYKENEAVAQALDRVQASIDGLGSGLSLRKHGSLLMEGEMRLFHSYHRSDMGTSTVYCFLVGDLFIVCDSSSGKTSKGSGRLACKFCVELPENCEVVIEEVGRFPGLRDWQLVLRQPETPSAHGNTTEDDLRYRLQLKSRRVQQAWLAAFQRAKAVRYPANHNCFGHRFLPHICQEPTKCMECGRLILVGFGQGYRCQATGRVVHRDCIPSAPRQRRSVDAAATAAPPTEVTASGAATAATTGVETAAEAAAEAAPPEASELVTECSGWQGQMSRGAAWARLVQTPAGTYLVRLSPRLGVTEYILSYRSADTVKHRKIFESVGQFYLDEDQARFSSIQQLLRHYSGAAGAADGSLEVQLTQSA